MNINVKKKIKEKDTIIILFLCMLLFKIACDWGYITVLVLDTKSYNNEFNELKYINGFIWCCVLFCGIHHGRRRVSVFMLYLVFLMQIVPITTIYSFGNGDAVFYNEICLSFLLCELIVSINVRKRVFFEKNRSYKVKRLFTKIMMIVLVMAIMGLLLYIFIKNGFPTLIALNFHNVYDLRRSDLFQINKYWHYVLAWSLNASIPFFLAKEIEQKKIMHVMFWVLVIYVLYLYTGQKSFFFSILVVIICTMWAKRRNFYKEIFMCACICFATLVFLVCYSPILKHLFAEIYSLFGRRLMILSANNKFVYYDFFSKNPKMGLGGIFPRWLINIPNYYENIELPYLIGELYYDAPEMWDNTGFLAEGYMRFGHIGTIIIMVIFACILRIMDGFQKRCGYQLAIGAFVYPVLMLTDTHLIDTVIFGVWTPIIMLLLLYTPSLKFRNKNYMSTVE